MSFYSLTSSFLTCNFSFKRLIDKFNPGSSVQKQEFFEFYGIESDKETKAGNPQWDRDALEELQKLLKTMIEDKE